MKSTAALWALGAIALRGASAGRVTFDPLSECINNHVDVTLRPLLAAPTFHVDTAALINEKLNRFIELGESGFMHSCIVTIDEIVDIMDGEDIHDATFAGYLDVLRGLVWFEATLSDFYRPGLDYGTLELEYEFVIPQEELADTILPILGTYAIQYLMSPPLYNRKEIGDELVDGWVGGCLIGGGRERERRLQIDRHNFTPEDKMKLTKTGLVIASDMGIWPFSRQEYYDAAKVQEKIEESFADKDFLPKSEEPPQATFELKVLPACNAEAPTGDGDILGKIKSLGGTLSWEWYDPDHPSSFRNTLFVTVEQKYPFAEDHESPGWKFSCGVTCYYADRFAFAAKVEYDTDDKEFKASASVNWEIP